VLGADHARLLDADGIIEDTLRLRDRRDVMLEVFSLQHVRDVICSSFLQRHAREIRGANPMTPSLSRLEFYADGT
jgi:hypothetical protein